MMMLVRLPVLGCESVWPSLSGFVKEVGISVSLGGGMGVVSSWKDPCDVGAVKGWRNVPLRQRGGRCAFTPALAAFEFTKTRLFTI